MKNKSKQIKPQTETYNVHFKDYLNDLDAAKKEIEHDVREAQQNIERAKTLSKTAKELRLKSKGIKDALVEKKKEIILRMAKKLIRYHICEKFEVGTRLRHDFKAYISNQWIRLVLPKEYKNQTMTHNPQGINQFEQVNNGQNEDTRSVNEVVDTTETVTAAEDEYAKQYSQMTIEYRELLSIMHSLIKRLTGLDDIEIARITSNTPKGQSARRYLMEQTQTYRFKLSKGLNQWGLQKHVSAMEDLEFLLTDSIKQFDSELELSKSKPMGI